MEGNEQFIVLLTPSLLTQAPIPSPHRKAQVQSAWIFSTRVLPLQIRPRQVSAHHHHSRRHRSSLKEATAATLASSLALPRVSPVGSPEIPIRSPLLHRSLHRRREIEHPTSKNCRHCCPCFPAHDVARLRRLSSQAALPISSSSPFPVAASPNHATG
ncbi:hypothetical protein M0R45_031077 [Rubus argutus]|uniref:Uncharacterized protein n=1 Tax=Rubus argutus TaxID=59490 RepID=A0AAW1WH95_RUBAR